MEDPSSAAKSTHHHIPFSDNSEYLQAELHCLDVVIRGHVARRRLLQPATVLEQFRGLVVSDEEIDALLARPPNSTQLGESKDADLGSTVLATELWTEIRERRLASLRQGVTLGLPRLSRIFGLGPLEEQCLLLALAPDIDPEYERLYAYLQDDLTRRRPTVGLALSLLCPPGPKRWAARRAFDPRSPLLSNRLLRLGGSAEHLPGRPLELDERVTAFLLGSDVTETRLEGFRCRSDRDGLRPRRGVDGKADTALWAFVRNWLSQSGSKDVGTCFVHGPPGSRDLWLTDLVCRDCDLPLLRYDLKRMKSGPLPLEESMALAGREAVLQQAVLALDNLDALLAEDDRLPHGLAALAEALQGFGRPTFLLSHRPWAPHGAFLQRPFLSVRLPAATERARQETWAVALEGRCGLAADVDLADLAGRFRLTDEQIEDAARMARNAARCRAPQDDLITAEDLAAACRAYSNQRLALLARKVPPLHDWEDLVLPENRRQQLRELCQWVRYRTRVYGDWGFGAKLSHGKGLNALFTGPSGTGKTLAAEVVAGELGLDLYQVDLASVVSKYIGETEKNLARIFAEAETSNAILFFDEADGLFCKRGEVRDAHDRYANLETAYLLQKMEEHGGLVILASNLRKNMDEAFVRRMHVTIEFPIPDEGERLRIWQRVWPDATPRRPDVDLDWLARRWEITGGNIHNIALASAFLAAADGGAIGSDHVTRAAQREFQKMGKLALGDEFTRSRPARVEEVSHVRT